MKDAEFKESDSEEEVEIDVHKIEECDGPGKFYLGDNRLEHQDDDDDRFSESDMSVLTAPDGQGLIKFALKA